MYNMDNTNAAYGIYAEDVQVNNVVRTLNDAGFPIEDICLMLARTHPIAAIVRDASILNTEREATAMTAGLISWLSDGAVVIPTVGFFIRSQTFFRALVTARNAPALCGSSQTLLGLGFSEETAFQRLEDQLYETGVLVYVACSESARGRWAMELLQRMGAQETAELQKEQGTGAAA
jgi:hypothetical protein